jgi:NADH-quinone oxidoreductase subunit M
MRGFPYITALTLTPIIGAIIVAGLDRAQRRLARGLGLGFSLLSLGWALWIWLEFDPALGLQFQERHLWIRSLDVWYYVGVDGLGLLMILLTGLIVPFALLASWQIGGNVKVYFSLVLLVQAGLYGAFTALNFFHWFIFWELGLIPAFFLIKLWGGPQRSHAATQFFIFTLTGSVAMLLAFQAIYLATGTFDFIKLSELGRRGDLALALAANLGWKNLDPQWLALVIGSGIFLGLAVKVPLIPFHTWLPAAYAEAPVGISMILTGVMSKMGVYGFLRLLVPLFPQQMRLVLVPLLWLAVITVVFSAWAVLAQRDLKRILAYSSINHLGYCLLGIFAAVKATGPEAAWTTEKAAALNGVLLQMFNHGLSASALFCFVGFLEKRSGELRGLHDFGGLRKIAPVFCGLMGIALFSSLGLPGLNGFVGEFLIFKGSFPLVTWATALSAFGLLFTAIFIMTILQSVFSGPLNERWGRMPDLTITERAMVMPAIGLMLLVGLYPQCVVGMINSTVLGIVEHLAH